MSQTVDEILKQAVFYSDEQEYIYLKLPHQAVMAAAGVIAEIGEPFCALLIDKDEVSLMIPADAWNDFQRRLPGAMSSEDRYCLITLDAELDFDLVGLMARVSAALAEAEISILPFAAYSRDHLFVNTRQVEAALAALKKLQQ